MEQPSLKQKERSLIARIFLSRDEPRLRAGWRLSGQLVLFLVFFLLLVLPVGLVFFLVPDMLLDFIAGELAGDRLLLVSAAVQLMAISASVYLARRLLDRRSFTSLGLWANRRAAADLLSGFLIAGAAIGLIFLLEWGLGWLKVEGFGWDILALPHLLLRLLILLVLTIFVGWAEELVFRGYWLQNLSQGLNLILGVGISSLLFALAHLGNPGISLQALAGLVLAGGVFAYSLLRSGGLWLPIGLHVGWNFFEGPVFGYEVSGLEAFRLLLFQQVDGPVLFTGGSFGPEAGLVLLPALALTAGLVALYTRRRKDKFQLEL